jgi:hypothetical protein
MHRDYLARAARLGFVELEVGGPEAPLCGRDGRRAYAWQPLGEGCAIGPDEAAIRVHSTAAEGPAPARITSSSKTPSHTATSRPSNRSVANGVAPAVGLPGLVEEAAALHAALGEARCRAARLVSGLRAERKRSRALASTIAQLRQIRLQDLAG